MTIPAEKVQEILEEVIEKFFKPKFIDLGMNASGKWLNSLSVEASDGKGIIKGIDYTYYLANGRAPGNMPPIQPLVEWVGYKFGITGNEARSAAFAIAKKIAREGTNYYPDGTDLVEVLTYPEVISYINSQISRELEVIVKLEILKILRK